MSETNPQGATPRVDALIPSQSFVDETRLFDREYFVPLLDLARTLERELTAAESALAEIRGGKACCDYGSYLESRAEAAESALAEANKGAESLARTVMSDQVSNDTATGKYEVYQVQFPSGEKCYFGELSTANAYARETGTVSFVSLPKREFKVVDVETKESYQRQSGAHFDKYQTALQRITDLQSRLDAAERDAKKWRGVDALFTGTDKTISVNRQTWGVFKMQVEPMIDAALSADKGDKHD